MPVKTIKFITRDYVQEHPDWLFVFGDNMDRKGFGGQAKAMRGEPNAVGIPTKISPDMHEGYSFFDDSLLTDYDPGIVKMTIDGEFLRLFVHAANGGTIVWPEDGIGTGLAELPTRAPKIWALIEEYRTALFKL